MCKIDEVTEAFSLGDPRHESIDSGLVARWRGENDHAEHGYRTLTEWFNKRLLWHVYEANNRETYGNRIEADYEALVGDDELVAEEVSADLRADGIAVETVRDAMVSWGTMRTHLLKCLEAEKETEPASDWERESIDIAREVAKEKTEAALSALDRKGSLSGTDSVEVDVDIQLRCTECPTVVPFSRALQRGYVCEQHSGAVDRQKASTEGQ